MPDLLTHYTVSYLVSSRFTSAKYSIVVALVGPTAGHRCIDEGSQVDYAQPNRSPASWAVSYPGSILY